MLKPMSVDDAIEAFRAGVREQCEKDGIDYASLAPLMVRSEQIIRWEYAYSDSLNAVSALYCMTSEGLDAIGKMLGVEKA